MEGIIFYFHLRHVLIVGEDIVGNGKYTFKGWSKNGGLRYRVNKAKDLQIKTIPPEIIVMSKHWQAQNIEITYKFLKANGHDNYCTPPVINYLLENF